MRHPLSGNATALFVIQFTNLIPFLLLPYLTRILGIEEFGVVLIVLACIQLSAVLTDYGFTLSATYTIAKNRDDKEFVSKLVGAIFGFKVILGFVATLGLALFAHFSSYSIHEPVFLMAIIAVWGQAFQPVWFFQGIERMRNITTYMVTSKFVYALFVFVLVEEPGDGVWVIFGWGVAQLIGAVIGVRQLYVEGYAILKPTLRDVIGAMTEAAQFFWSRVAVAIYTSASTVVVGAWGGVTQAAYFGVCEQVYKVGQNVTSPINTALYPYMANRQDWSILYRLVIVISVGLSLGGMGVYAFSEEILALLFGEAYVVAAEILYVFLVAIVVTYVSITFGYPAFAALGDVRFANTSVMIGAIVHSILLGILMINDAVTGFTVASSILVTELVVLTLRLVRVWQYKNLRNECSIR